MKSITVATYNIRHGHDVGLDFSKLAEVINATEADLIGLQEVDMLTNRVHGKNSILELQSSCGYPYAVFTPAMSYDGGHYGTAIFSKHPIRFFASHELFNGGSEPRSVGIVEVTLPNGSEIRLVNTHLCYESKEIRSIQIKQIAYRCGELMDSTLPTVITGDLNTADLMELEPFSEYGFQTVNGLETVYPTFRPSGAAIDHILYRKNEMTLVSCKMLSIDRSDHNPLISVFSIQ